jgi:hypothetical protein
MLPETSHYNKNNFLVELFLQKTGVFLNETNTYVKSIQCSTKHQHIITVTAQ